MVENVIGLLKRFKIIEDRYRSRRKCFCLRFNSIAGIYSSFHNSRTIQETQNQQPGGRIYSLSRNNPIGVRYERHRWLQVPALAISDYCGKGYKIFLIETLLLISQTKY